MIRTPGKVKAGSSAAGTVPRSTKIRPVNGSAPSPTITDTRDHGYQGVKFHDLRHIHATMLLQHRVDLQSVSSRMGHSDPSITLRAYADAMPARDQEAAATMDQLLIAGGAQPAEPVT